jgi:two-component system heavy metal sensor histidine kinase CusS
MKFNSIKFKICVLYLVIISGWLILYRTATYISLRRTLFKTVDYELTVKAQAINKTIQRYLDVLGEDRDSFAYAIRKTLLLENGHPDEVKTRDIEFQWVIRFNKFDLNKDYINFVDPQGEPLVHTPHMTQKLVNHFTKQAKEDGGRITHRSLDYKRADLHVRIISVPFSYKGYQNYTLQVGTSFKPSMVILRQQLVYSAVIFPVILFIAIFATWIIVGQILKPVMEIAKTAKNISLENLSERVKIRHFDEEMKYLADAFNGMIARLEESFQYISQFSTYVSHELKTPLAIIKGEAELALRQGRETKEYKRVLTLALEEIGRMLKIISDLLLLAKLEYKKEVIKFEKIDFTELLQEVREATRLLILSKDIEFNVDIPQQPILINGNKLHLRRLFLNLIDNAVKFTPKNGKITLSARLEDAKVIASVSDTGMGIAEEDFPKLFKKFFTRDKGEQGEVIHGLGLNIIQYIIKIHQGNITVKSEVHKGSTFTVTLPLA